MALSECLINIKAAVIIIIITIFVTRAPPEASPQPAPAAAAVRILDPELAVPQPVSSSEEAGSGDGTQPLSSGGTGRGPGRLAHQPTAARPSAQGPVGRQGLGQRPWSPALTLGPGSPVSGGHPSATAPPARNGAQGRRSRAAPRPARRKSEMLAGAGEELLAPSRGRNGAQLPKSPQAAMFTLTI